MNARSLAVVRRVLQGFGWVRLAYLYGSALAREDFRDVDVALKVRPKARLDSMGLRLKASAALSRRLPWEFDVHLLEEMPLPLQHRVIATGRCVLSRSDVERTRYESRVLSEFLDFQPAHDRLVESSLLRAARS